MKTSSRNIGIGRAGSREHGRTQMRHAGAHGSSSRRFVANTR